MVSKTKTLGALELSLRNVVTDLKGDLLSGIVSYDKLVSALNSAAERQGFSDMDPRALLGRIRWFAMSQQIPLPKQAYHGKDGSAPIKKDVIVDQIASILGVDCDSLAPAKKPVLKAILAAIQPKAE